MAPHVLMIPFPAQGHMIPLLDLAHLLSSHQLHITVLTTPANRHLLSSLVLNSPSIQTLTLPFPSTDLLPAGQENLQNLPPPAFPVFFHVLGYLRDPLRSWIASQAETQEPITAILSDFFLGWTQPLAEELKLPRIVFTPSAVIATAVIHSLFRRMPKRTDPMDDDEEFTFPQIPKSPCLRWWQMSFLYRSYVEGDEFSESVKMNFLWNLDSWGFVSNTFHAIEKEYLVEPLEDLGGKKVWAVGPLAPRDGAGSRGGVPTISEAEITSWLDNFPEGSVVYVSFGSQAVLTSQQAAALAGALEKSGVSFVWSVRGSTILPEGFEQRSRKKGMLIRGWAPQIAILRHEAVGWFLTHCGWNSVLEALAAGVAMLSWPMTADQHIDAKLLEEIGVAERACTGGLNSIPDEDELAQVLSRTIGEGGRGMRKHAGDFARMSMEAVAEGGSSYSDLHGLVDELRKLEKIHK